MPAPAERALPVPRLGPLAALGAVWGPGLLVMLADTDAGNVITAADAGARWGYRLLPLPLLLIPALALVQDLAARIGIVSGLGFGDLVRRHLSRPWRGIAAAALVVATLGSLVTEFTGIAGVGDLFGVPRAAALALASLCLILAVLTGRHVRVERVALLVGLFEFAFFLVAWDAHPTLPALARDIADQPLTEGSYLFLAAGLIGATFNPWMLFYQASALAGRRLVPTHHGAHLRAARCDTIAGAVLTQCLTAAVLVGVAAVAARGGTPAGLGSVGDIAGALIPLLGPTTGRVVFGIGVVGAAMAAAVVCSLACAWGLAEILGAPREAAAAPWFRRGYALGVLATTALVLLAPDLVRLSVATQVLNAALLPVVGGLLVAVSARALPEPVRLSGRALWVTAGTVGVVGAAGLAGALAGLL